MSDVLLDQNAWDGVAISISCRTWGREKANMMTLLSDYHCEKRLYL